MLGNFSGVERLMNEGEMRPLRPRRDRVTLTVHVTFEESRLAASCLATAYEQIMPLRRRAGAVGHSAPAPGQSAPRSGERTGT